MIFVAGDSSEARDKPGTVLYFCSKIDRTGQNSIHTGIGQYQIKKCAQF